MTQPDSRLDQEAHPSTALQGQDADDYRQAFVLDCEIDMEASACDLTFFKVDSTRNFYREFLSAAGNHKFRLWLRYQMLGGAKTLESHGVSTKKDRLMVQIVVEAFHVFELVNPLELKES
jgi:hypothetical protein